MENKKTLIVSIIGILVLIGAVIGVSIAMYTFSGTGTKTNLIKTGQITLNVAKAEGNSFTFDGTYPMTDSKGVSLTENSAEISVSSSWTSNTPVTIKYDLGIEIISQGTTLKSNYIKVALVDSTGKVLVGQGSGTNLTGGVTISSLASTKGPNNLITTYGLTGGTLKTSGATDKYTIYGWVSDQYDLPVDKTNTTSDNTGTASNNNNTLHKKQTGSETFKFRIKVIGSQVTEEESVSNAVYSWSESNVSLGTTKDSISGYTTDYTTLGKTFFLKHNIGSNNTVESQEVCYILNGTMYCLTGGDEGASYETNKETLFASFGEDNCSVYSDRVHCSASGLNASAYSHGLVSARGDIGVCVVYGDGDANCYE